LAKALMAANRAEAANAAPERKDGGKSMKCHLLVLGGILGSKIQARIEPCIWVAHVLTADTKRAVFL